jgi:hypothetical protein
MGSEEYFVLLWGKVHLIVVTCDYAHYQTRPLDTNLTSSMALMLFASFQLILSPLPVQKSNPFSEYVECRVMRGMHTCSIVDKRHCEQRKKLTSSFICVIKC